MKNIAIFVKGFPVKKEDSKNFDSYTKKNFEIISEIAKRNNYQIKYTSLGKIVNDKEKCLCKGDGDVIFYYTGHANSEYIGTEDFKIQQVFDYLDFFKGKKYIFIDGCAAEEGFEKHNFPKNSITISASEVYPNKSISKLLYDALVFKNNGLNDLNKETFNELKHNWVYVKEED